MSRKYRLKTAVGEYFCDELPKARIRFYDGSVTVLSANVFRHDSEEECVEIIFTPPYVIESLSYKYPSTHLSSNFPPARESDV